MDIEQIAALDLGWQREAACDDDRIDPELFFPERGQTGRRAREVCARCPVRAQCLEYALNTRAEFGIFGGLSAKQRRKLHGLRRGESAA